MSLDDDTLQRGKRAGEADQTRTKTASQLSLDPPKRTGGGGRLPQPDQHRDRDQLIQVAGEAPKARRPTPGPYALQACGPRAGRAGVAVVDWVAAGGHRPTRPAPPHPPGRPGQPRSPSPAIRVQATIVGVGLQANGAIKVPDPVPTQSTAQLVPRCPGCAGRRPGGCRWADRDGRQAHERQGTGHAES
jgi:hypothetical protein